MRIFIVRHGQTEWNDQKRVQGHTDVGLNGVGKWQAGRLAESLTREGVERIISSDLTRAKETAQIVGLRVGLPVELSKTLRERSYGEWEGVTYKEFSDRLSEFITEENKSTSHVTPPGGESLLDLYNRVGAVAEEVLKKASSTLIISHGGACTQLLCHFLKIPFAPDRKFKFENATITEITFFRDGNRSLIRHNDGSHLRRVEAKVDAMI